MTKQMFYNTCTLFNHLKKRYLLIVDRATNVTLQLYILSINSINEMAMVRRTCFVANTMIDDF